MGMYVHAVHVLVLVVCMKSVSYGVLYGVAIFDVVLCNSCDINGLFVLCALHAMHGRLAQMVERPLR